MVKYKQIAGELRNQILSAGNLKPHKLPTELELCQKYGVSRQTVRQALLTLEDEKLITRRQGSGAYTVPQAEHLREKKIILLISEENEYIYPKFIGTLRSELRRHNLSLTVFATENDINKERTILTKLLDESFKSSYCFAVITPKSTRPSLVTRGSPFASFLKVVST